MLDGKKNKGRHLPYLRNPNVRWFDLDLSDLRTMPFEEREDARYGLQAGDVVICEGGEAGRAAIYDGTLGELKFQKAIHRVRAGPTLYNRYLVHRLMADYYGGRLSDYYTGTTIKHLTGQDLARYHFPLPPYADQQRVATILDNANALRAKRRAALAQLDTLTQSIFLEMFGGPAANSKRWPIRTLAELGCEFRYGTSNKSTVFGKPTLRIPNVVNGSIDLSDLKLVPVTDSEFERLKLRNGDLLFVRTNGNPDFVGRCALFDHHKVASPRFDADQFIFASYLIRARIPGEVIEPLFLREYLLGREGSRQLRARCQTSAGQYNLNTESLAKIGVPIVRLARQQEFAARVKVVEGFRRRLQSALAELDTLFASLQHRAFRGEL